MNTLLKKMMGKTKKKHNIMDYEKYAKKTKKFGLLLIPVSKKKDIFAMEKFLRIFMHPKLNSYSVKFTEKHENKTNLNDSLYKILNSMKK